MYRLENRYQDSNWTPCEDVQFPCADIERACRRARKLSQDTIAFGMVRVIDKKGNVVGTYSAGKVC